MPVVFLILGLVVFFLHWGFQRKYPKKTLELLLGYLMLFTFGFNGVANFLGHVFYSDRIAALIGWVAGSPFQFEVGIANLAFGILAILSFWLRKSFLFAALLGNTIWLWGDAIGHVRNMIETGNFAAGNSGVYFFADVFIPILIGVVYWLREARVRP
ncbi:MAG: hypothetical protein K940chlam6_01320 [Chlamydiae bacterium]|nr:hypothetical protein [Chlamydiota bacterium]